MERFGFKITPGRIFFLVTATAMLIGVLTYLQLAFEGADAKTAIRLVEEARVGERPLRDHLDRVLPLQDRLCDAYFVSRFYGHLKVTCRNVRQASHILRWNVNVIDGMVQPDNLAAKKLGKGEAPW